MKKYKAIFLLPLLLILSCNEESYTPKPKGYFRIDLPEKNYQPLNKENCPFTFEIPTYCTTIQDKNRPDQPCWFDVVFSDLNASLYLSYKPINDNINKFLEDSRTLAFKHTIKANDIEQEVIMIPEKNVYGLIYNIEGNAASSLQFHLTDSTKHFIRCSLYFNNVPNQDSVKPVLEFIKEDIDRMINSFEWKN